MPKKYRVVIKGAVGGHSISEWREYDFDKVCAIAETMAEMPIEFRFEFE